MPILFNIFLFESINVYELDAIGDIKEKDVKFRLEKLFNEEKREWYFEVHMIKKIQGTFFEKLELYHFPFDVQVKNMIASFFYLGNI